MRAYAQEKARYASRCESGTVQQAALHLQKSGLGHFLRILVFARAFSRDPVPDSPTILKLLHHNSVESLAWDQRISYEFGCAIAVNGLQKLPRGCIE